MEKKDLHVLIPAEEYKAMSELAAEEEQSASKMVSKAIRFYLKARKKIEE